MATSTAISAAIQTALSGLAATPGAISTLLGFGKKETAAGAVTALQYIDDIHNDPAGAASYMGSLSATPNLPNSVMVDVSSALAAFRKTPPDNETFEAGILAAKTAVIAAMPT